MVACGVAEWGPGKTTLRIMEWGGRKLETPIVLAIEADGLRRIS